MIFEVMEELKPCPFCGSKAKLVQDGETSFKIFCTGANCDAAMGWCISRKSLVNDWNRRADVEQET